MFLAAVARPRYDLIQKVLRTIKSKWPSGFKVIIIQQDNARPYIDPSDLDFIAAAKSDGFDIQWHFQPPNSPDLNVLDLGFFRAIQSLQQQEVNGSINDLVAAVEKSFNEISSECLDMFLSLQQTMIETLKFFGDNNFKSPHMGKQSLKREENLPLVRFRVIRDIVERALAAL